MGQTHLVDVQIKDGLSVLGTAQVKAQGSEGDLTGSTGRPVVRDICVMQGLGRHPLPDVEFLTPFIFLSSRTHFKK